MANETGPGLGGRTKEEHGARVSAGMEAQREIVANRAEDRLRKRNEAGAFVDKLSEDEWEDVLERISCGASPSAIMKSYGLSPSALNAKESRDPEFKAALSAAFSTAFFGFVYEARDVLRGVEGLSTGHIERDKAIADLDYKLAKVLVPRMVEKLQVDQRTISITVQRDDTDW